LASGSFPATDEKAPDHKVALPQAVFQKLSTGFFASAGQMVWNRFTGPGKIALQSMYYHMDGGE
jgi:uncharacterized protein (AIM24 family)